MGNRRRRAAISMQPRCYKLMIGTKVWHDWSRSRHRRWHWTASRIVRDNAVSAMMSSIRSAVVPARMSTVVSAMGAVVSTYMSSSISCTVYSTTIGSRRKAQSLIGCRNA